MGHFPKTLEALQAMFLLAPSHPVLFSIICTCALRSRPYYARLETGEQACSSLGRYQCSDHANEAYRAEYLPLCLVRDYPAPLQADLGGFTTHERPGRLDRLSSLSYGLDFRQHSNRACTSQTFIELVTTLKLLDPLFICRTIVPGPAQKCSLHEGGTSIENAQAIRDGRRYERRMV